MGFFMSELTIATAALAEYRAARTRILTGGQDVTLNGKRQTMANLATIEAEIKHLEARCQALSGTIRFRTYAHNGHYSS